MAAAPPGVPIPTVVADPPEVLFPFTDEAGPHQVRVRLVNTSGQPQRVVVEPLLSDVFAVDLQPAGRVAPGLSQDLTISFTPGGSGRQAPSFAELRVRSDGPDVFLPIRAYPVPAAFALPERVDFGRVELGATATRAVELRAGGGAEFEFEVTVVRGHPDLTVSPARGRLLPGAGAPPVELVIEYPPRGLATATAEVLVSVTSYRCPPARLAAVAQKKA